jgi:hypothetical protein
MLDETEICWTDAMVRSRATHPTALPKGRDPATKALAGGDIVKREGATGQFVSFQATQVEAVMAAAQRSGLLLEKSGRIGGRVSPVLVERAKARTGIETDTDLIEFALANIALDDKFAENFKASRGKVDPDLKLGF